MSNNGRIGQQTPQITVDQVITAIVNLSRQIRVSNQRYDSAMKQMDLEKKNLDALISQRESLLMDLTDADTNAKVAELTRLQEGLANKTKLEGTKEEKKVGDKK